MVVQKCSQYIEHRTQSAYFMDQNVVYFCNKKIEYLSRFYATPSVSLRSLSVGGSGYYPSLQLGIPKQKHFRLNFQNEAFDLSVLFLILHSKCSETDLNPSCGHQDILDVGIVSLHFFSSGFVVQTLVLHGTEILIKREISYKLGI